MQQLTYRDILNQTFKDRNLSNAGYSMRSFARDLGVPPSTLSEVLNGKKGISVKRSVDLAKKLSLPEWQIHLFVDLVTKEHAKSPKEREEAKVRLQDHKKDNHIRLVNHTALKALTSWADLAILELTYLKNFELSPSWIAKKLNLDVVTISNSIERLKEANLLEQSAETGKWMDTSPLFTSTDGVPNENIRQFHQTVLNLGIKKLENPDTRHRTVKSVVFSLSKSNIPQAKKVLDEAIAKIVALADESSQEREEVMCFSSQLFSLIESQETI